MEGLVLMVITFVVGSLISGAKNRQQNQKPMPPFNNQPTEQKVELPKQTERRTSLEDFASQVFQQLNEKAQPKNSAPSSDSQPEPIKAIEVEEKHRGSQRVPLNSRPAFDENRSSNRTSANPKAGSSDFIKENEIGNIVPTTRTALVQAIITTEILGPPKAKQR